MQISKAIFSPSSIVSGSAFPAVSGSKIVRLPATKAPIPKMTGAKLPSNKIYGAKMVPNRLTTNENPIPTPRTTVGYCSAENRLSIVYEQLAPNRPKTDNPIRYLVSVRKGCIDKANPERMRNPLIERFRPKLGCSRVKMT